ncbi:DUF190 domain-containing protein [Streptomyces sp. OfavH-34-F]|uniref:DUF190 domain-containing protein n=1 Tax=unclassified Streptomyces TaxID=2593676 RepID=UPI001679D74F|nr:MULTISPECIES: DUF190 domain-containing protein [unclassified Streptomyces]MCG7522914.1 DUF190 domain-containing protein [Streptomyces sp. OfavH-34-F]MCX5417968.1 DUF190 domain-containing protein [Streptomyces sp. NBC_00059]GHE39635.1 UPF0166 protein [Streptomyces cellulosae]
MTFHTHPAVRLTIVVDDTDTWHHKPVCSEIVHRAHRAGLRGASIFHGVEGFGGRQIIHTTRLLSLADDLPVAVVIVDTGERIHSFLPQLEELGIEGLITLEDVRTVHFGHDTPADRP